MSTYYLAYHDLRINHKQSLPPPHVRFISVLSGEPFRISRRYYQGSFAASDTGKRIEQSHLMMLNPVQDDIERGMAVEKGACACL